MMKVAISGASGFVGTALTNRLRESGHEVIAIGRNPSRAEDIRWDIPAGHIESDKLEDVDAIVNMSGASIANWPWTESAKRAIRHSRVDGTRLLATTINALDRKPRVFVSTSAVGFYGSQGAQKLGEDAGQGQGFLADVCQGWESASHDAEGVRVVNPRFGLVLGASGGMLPLIAKPFRFGVGGKIGSGDQYMAWIALDDLIALLAKTIEDDSLEGPVNAVAPVPITNQEFTSAMGKAVHRPTMIPLPTRVASAIGGEMARELLLVSQRVVPERARQAGFVWQYPTIESCLEAYL